MSWSSPLCSLLQSPLTSSFVNPNIFCYILSSNTPSLCSSLYMCDQSPLSHKTTVEIWQLSCLYSKR
jgi:hypothetical protein